MPTPIESLCRNLTQALHDRYAVVDEGVDEVTGEPAYGLSYKPLEGPDARAVRDLCSYLDGLTAQYADESESQEELF